LSEDAALAEALRLYEDSYLDDSVAEARRQSLEHELAAVYSIAR